MVTHSRSVREDEFYMTTRFMRQRHTSLFMVLMFLLCSVSAALGQVTFAPLVNYNAGTTPYTVAVGDFNADGKVDMAVPHFASNNISIVLGTGRRRIWR